MSIIELHPSSSSNNSNSNSIKNTNARDKETVPTPTRSSGLTVVNGPRATTAPSSPKTTSLKKGRLGFIYYNMWNRRKSDDGDNNIARTAKSDAKRSYGG